MNFNYCPKCGKKGTVQKQDNTNYECANCQWHFWNNAKAATALILVKDSLILFGKRAHEPNKGMYDIPGGFVDYGETAQAGAIREAQEELGVTIHKQDLELLDAYRFDYIPGVTTVDLVFLVRKWKGNITPSSDLADVAWKPVSFLHDPSFVQTEYFGLDKLLAAKIPGLKQ